MLVEAWNRWQMNRLCGALIALCMLAITGIIVTANDLRAEQPQSDIVIVDQNELWVTGIVKKETRLVKESPQVVSGLILTTTVSPDKRSDKDFTSMFHYMAVNCDSEEFATTLIVLTDDKGNVIREEDGEGVWRSYEDFPGLARYAAVICKTLQPETKEQRIERLIKEQPSIKS